MKYLNKPLSVSLLALFLACSSAACGGEERTDVPRMPDRIVTSTVLERSSPVVMSALAAEGERLVVADSAMHQQFGMSVGVSGDTAIIGARGDNEKGIGAGAAYIYVRDGGSWVQRAKLFAADACKGITSGSRSRSTATSPL